MPQLTNLAFFRARRGQTEALGAALAGVYCECSPETLRIPSKSFRP